MRYASMVDGNANEITNALRAWGATVQSLAKIGAGAPDLLVGFRGKEFLLEIKDPRQDHGRRKPGLRSHGSKTVERQIAWTESWAGSKVVVVHSVQEALIALGVGQ